jgi:hypothetical protein
VIRREWLTEPERDVIREALTVYLDALKDDGLPAEWLTTRQERQWRRYVIGDLLAGLITG